MAAAWKGLDKWRGLQEAACGLQGVVKCKGVWRLHGGARWLDRAAGSSSAARWQVRGKGCAAAVWSG